MSRSLLENAAELLNKIWLAYREEICADQTDQIVWKSPRRLILRSGCLEKTIKKRPGTTSPLMKFPEKLCKLPHDKVILLNFLQCNVAVTHMQCILEWLLKDVASKIEVALFLLKDPPLIVTMEPDGNPPVSNAGFRHVCWRVTMSSTEVYAIDLTGCQYGWYEPVCPWTECFERRCLNEVALNVGFRDDETMAPLTAADSDPATLKPPKVDDYYILVQEHFSKSMKTYLDGLPVAILRIGSGSARSCAEKTLIEEVKRKAELATLAADEVWSTFPWKST